QPRPPAARTCRPPASVALNRTSCPLRVALTGRPTTETLTVDGTNPSSRRRVAPRLTSACFEDFAIGAPQRDPQHQEETASGTRPAGVWRYAEGGRARPSSTASSTVIASSLLGPQDACDQPEKIRSRSGESLCRVTRVRGWAGRWRGAGSALV